MKNKTKITWGLLMMAAMANGGVAEEAGAPSPYKSHLFCVNSQQELVLSAVISKTQAVYHGDEGTAQVSVAGYQKNVDFQHYIQGLRYGSLVSIEMNYKNAQDPFAMQLEVQHEFHGPHAYFLSTSALPKGTNYSGYLTIPALASIQVDQKIPVSCQLIDFNSPSSTYNYENPNIEYDPPHNPDCKRCG